MTQDLKEIQAKLGDLKKQKEELKKEVELEILKEVKKIFNSRKVLCELKSLDESISRDIDKMMSRIGFDFLNNDPIHWESSSAGCEYIVV